MPRKIRFEAVYPYSPDQVWVALTDPSAMSDWLMPNDFEAKVGHRFNFTTKPAPGFDGIVNCEVLELDRPRRVSYSWEGGGIDTIVTYDLNAEGDGTRVIMEQSGFTGLRGFMISKILGGGWKKMVEASLPTAASKVRDGVYRPE